MNSNTLSNTADTSISKSRAFKIDVSKDMDSSTINKNSQSKPYDSKSSPKEDKKTTSLNSNNLTEMTPSRRSKSPSVSSKTIKGKSNNLIKANKRMKKKVNFKENNFLDIVLVESYKKYNVDMSYNESEKGETTRCRCSIF